MKLPQSTVLRTQFPWRLLKYQTVHLKAKTMSQKFSEWKYSTTLHLQSGCWKSELSSLHVLPLALPLPELTLYICDKMSLTRAILSHCIVFPKSGWIFLDTQTHPHPIPTKLLAANRWRMTEREKEQCSWQLSPWYPNPNLRTPQLTPTPSRGSS